MEPGVKFFSHAKDLLSLSLVIKILTPILNKRGFNPPKAIVDEDYDDIWFDDDRSIESCYNEINTKQFLNTFDYLISVTSLCFQLGQLMF
jgi:hypothetical protein